MSPAQEEDRLPGRSIAKIAIASAIVMALSLVATHFLLVDRARAEETNASPIVYPKHAASLDRWEWVDRDAGLARIPIDRAMDLVVEGSDGGAP